VSRYSDNEDGIPWGMWEAIVGRALAGRRGQAAMAAMEAALLQLPAPRLAHGHLAADGTVCAVGALVAQARAAAQGVPLAEVVEAMNADVRCYCGHGRAQHAGGRCMAARWRPYSTRRGEPLYGCSERCYCGEYEREMENLDSTSEVGMAEAGLGRTVAWHLAYLNDEQFHGATPEERYVLFLQYVRRAQGKPDTLVEVQA
jgi:hypothetical protein